MEIIQEFIEALDCEIEALKRGQGNNIVTVYNGTFLKQTLELYIYQFNLESFLIVLEDTPAQIEINGTEYECEIISVNGQQVQIAVKEQLSKFIPTAKIKTNTWYLLEILKKKYQENSQNKKKFENSQRLFSGIFCKIDEGNFHPTYSTADKKNNPTESQNNAVISSLNDFPSIIWGPPGTGKTRTIALAIESHLNQGRKVLLVSHSNNAVDQALEKVAEQTKNSYYKRCQLIRLGTPKAEKLQLFQSEWPLVLVDKIVEHKSAELVHEKNQLLRQLDEVKLRVRRYEKVMELWEEIMISEENINDLSSKFKTTEKDYQNQKKEQHSLKKKIDELRNKLNQAQTAGALKRTLLGLNSDKLTKNMNELSAQLKLTLEQMGELKNSLIQTRELIGQKQEIKEKKRSELLGFLSGEKNSTEVKERIQDLQNQEQSILAKISEIDSKIEGLKVSILSEAKLVATTLTKSYISKEIEKIDFDILIVDEVSMAPLPMLYWAASKAKKGITIVGDFKQLPPIAVADEETAKKWLKRNIFNVLELDSVSKAVANPDKVKLLDIQYRMNPLISEIPRTWIYENMLKDDPSTKNKVVTDPLSGNAPICLVDTSSHNPWCSQLDSGRFNLISALISVTLAERILESTPNDDISIGIITPYRNQARLILKIAKDKSLLDSKNLRINTVHSFQGGEETVIIFDCVEGLGAKKWSMINEFDNIESAKLLLNTALTRPEKKIYLVANEYYFNQLFPENSLFVQTLRHFKQKGVVKKSTEIFNNFGDEKFEYWIEKISQLNNRNQNIGESYSEKEFWPAFINDLANIENEVIIFSPFLTPIRVGKLQYHFSHLVNKGKKIYVLTLPPNHQPIIMRKDAIQAIKQLKQLGIVVKFRDNMHEKIALVDRRIKWVGSLNILSHNDKQEYMERCVGENAAKELYDKFDLETLLTDSNIVGNPCPAPNCDGFIALKRQRKKPHRKFYGCTNYPLCNWTQNIEDKYAKYNGYRRRKQSNYSQAET